MGLFDLQGGIASFINKLADLLLLNLVFVLSCVPILTIGCAWSALYHTVNKTLWHGRGYPLREYVSAFRRNFRQTETLWLGFLLFGVFLSMDTVLVLRNEPQGGILHQFFLALLLMEIIVANCLFPYLARFENTIKQAFINSVRIAISNLPKLLICTALGVFLLVALYFVLPAIFILPILIVWCQCILLEPVFRRYMSEEDRAKEDELNADPS